jgi:hypothetical protein
VHGYFIGTIGCTQNWLVECGLLERAMVKSDNKNVHYLTSERRRKSFREFYFPQRHTVLLVTIVAFLAAWPLFAGAAGLAKIVFAVALLGVLERFPNR